MSDSVATITSADDTSLKGADLGREIEAEFTRSAQEGGFSDDETKNAYNTNMANGGGALFHSSKPTEFADQHKRKWLVSSFEAGDIVLHDPFTVSASRTSLFCLTQLALAERRYFPRYMPLASTPTRTR